jgi:hypothetical protein
MSKHTSPLDEVRVAAPCRADWSKMSGDERVRYCDSCSLHVYNLSGMTRREAEVLMTSTEGRLCVRFYRRADGTILTRNCPVGLSAVRRRVARVAGSVLTAVVGFFAGLGLNVGLERALSPSIMGESAVPAPPMPPPPVALPVEEEIEFMMGGIAVPLMGQPVVGRVRVEEPGRRRFVTNSRRK